MTRPTVVTLCGSTRFRDQYMEANEKESFAGRIVLTCGFFAHAEKQQTLDPKDKIKLDVLHLRKIDLSDEILVLNVGGYIGESTSREIEYAKSIGKRIRYLEWRHE